MAREYTPEEIARIQAQVDDQVRRFGYTVRDLDDALNDAKIGVRGYTASVRSANADFRKAIANMTKPLEGTESLAEAVKKTGDAIGEFSSKQGALGKASGKLTQLFADLTAKGIRNLDVLSKTYQATNKLGAGFGSFEDVFKSLQQFNYSVDEAGASQLASLFRDNADAMLYFGKGLSGGRKELTDMTRSFVRSDLYGQFRLLGMSADEVNRHIAAFGKITAQTGKTFNNNIGEANKAIEAYILQSDRITRLTGATREQQESALNEAMSDQRYRGLMIQAEDAGRQDVVANLKTFGSFLAKVKDIDPEIAQGLRDIVAGDRSTVAAGKAMHTFGTSLEDLRGVILSGADGMKNFPAVMEAMAKEAKTRTSTFAPLMTQGAADFMFGPSGRDMASIFANFAANREKVTPEQKTAREQKGTTAEIYTQMTLEQERIRQIVELGRIAQVIGNGTDATNKNTSALLQMYQEFQKFTKESLQEVQKAIVSSRKKEQLETPGQIGIPPEKRPQLPATPPVTPAIPPRSEAVPSGAASLAGLSPGDLQVLLKEFAGRQTPLSSALASLRELYRETATNADDFKQKVRLLSSGVDISGQDFAKLLMGVKTGLTTDIYNSRTPTYTGQYFNAELAENRAPKGGYSPVVNEENVFETKSQAVSVKVVGLSDQIAQLISVAQQQHQSLEGVIDQIRRLNSTSYDIRNLTA